jgi:hypothetical protein
MKSGLVMVLAGFCLQLAPLSSLAAGAVECWFPEGYGDLSDGILRIENGSYSFQGSNGDSLNGELEREISLKPTDFESSAELAGYLRTDGMSGAEGFAEARFFVTDLEDEGQEGYQNFSGLIAFFGKGGTILGKGFALGPIRLLIPCLR